MRDNEIAIAHNYEKLYELLMEVLAQPYETLNTDRALATLELLATFNWNIHTGYFVDARLDQWAVKIGRKLSAAVKDELLSPPNGRHENTNRVLHVASQTYAVGGHTRMLLNIIESDPESTHDLILTRQPTGDVPSWLLEAVSSSGGTVISLVECSRSDKVVRLQQSLQSANARILYHIHPDDAEAVAALGLAKRCKIAFINHADHLFWLGASVVDTVVCIRDWSMKLSMSRRMAREVMLLPIPLTLNKKKQEGKEAARQELGIAAEETIVLTVATAYKFIPSGKFNYFRTVANILAVRPLVKFKIIGISPADDLSKFDFVPDNRIELLGYIEDPRLYYEAADIYLDCMPFSSFTSMYEAIFYRCFPILQFAPDEALVITQEPVFKNLMVHPDSEQGLVKNICDAIDDSVEREKTVDIVSQRVISVHMGAIWKEHLDAIYAAVEGPGSVEGPISPKDLHTSPGKKEPNRDDLDAVIRSYSIYGSNAYHLSNLLANYLKYISSSQLIRIYWHSRNNLKYSDTLFSFRRLMGLLKMKIRADSAIN